MDKAKLASVIRQRADNIQAREPRLPEDLDDAELLRVLARILEGKDIYRSFGAPGDWGYGTPIGAAIAAR